MAKTAKLYTRLPGTGSSSFQRIRLWLGPDHLLLVGSSFVGERYRRFYFADIQAIVICQTATWVVSAIIILIAALAAGAGALVPNLDPVLRWIFIGIGAFFLLVLFVHLYLGQTCLCQVRTAVQTEPLPSLRRLRDARAVLARLRPLIEAAQASATTAPQTG